MRGPSIAAGVLGVVTMISAVSADAQPRWGRPSTPRDGACFYRDKNYAGDYFCTDAGRDIAVLPNGMNDQITSIRTFGNVLVTIYADGRFRGKSTEVRGDVRNVGDDWNDKISSMRVSRVSGREHEGDRNRDQRHQWTEQQAEAMVARAYRTLLRRDPDPASRTWVDQVRSNNWTEQQLMDEIKKSPEYREKHPRG